MKLTSRQLSGDARLQFAADSPRSPVAPFEVSPAIAKLQQGLLDLDYSLPLSTRKKGEPDGIFGTETTAVLKQFQREHALKADGLAGPDTLGRMDQLLGLPRRQPRIQPAPDIFPSVERLVFKKTEQLIEIVHTVDDGTRDVGDVLGSVLKNIPGDLARIKQHPAEQGDPDGNTNLALQKKKTGATHVLTDVNIVREFEDRGTQHRPGFYVLRYRITRSYSYTWGPGNHDTRVRITRSTRTIAAGKVDNGHTTTFEGDQPPNYDDP